jgi:tetratricopeptide (TPR) repeat protein
MADGTADLSRGLDLLQRGEFDAAFQCLKAASAAVPRDPRLPGALRDFARLAGNRAGADWNNAAETIRLNALAIEAYALRADTPNDDHDRQILGMVFLNLGTTFDAIGQAAEAIKHYGNGLALMPDYVGVALNLAYLLVEANRAPEAVRLLSPLVAKFPENESLTAQLITALQQARQVDEAVALAKQAASRFPNLQAMYFGYYYRYTKGGAVLTA